MNEDLKNNNEMVELVEEVDTYEPEEEFEESGGILKKGSGLSRLSEILLSVPGALSGKLLLRCRGYLCGDTFGQPERKL